MRQTMESMLRGTQEKLCVSIAALDGEGTFSHDSWERPDGGGGTSRVMQGGRVFEKAGVGVSVVHGTLTPEAAKSMGGGHELTGPDALKFAAVGLSLVFHPHNPFAPTVHANYRYFERGDGEQEGAWWFGGGADLTPSYLFEEDVAHFHQIHKDACDRHDSAFYPRFKKWADDYFHIKHRHETRGVGGIFFDDLRDRSKDQLFGFVSDCASSFLPAYMPVVERRQDTPFTEEHKRWQQVRRGRYVEFNLVYDRGTVFGLRTAGRIESILMSLPLTARWEYCHEVAEGSEEARMVEVLQTPREWART
jgi:coproporphyrinogen III oxidase